MQFITCSRAERVLACILLIILFVQQNSLQLDRVYAELYVESLNEPVVRITEVAWMGSERSTADEWLEIGYFPHGSGSTTISLDGWTVVSVKNDQEEVIAEFDQSHVLEKGVYQVVSNYSAADSVLALEPFLVTTDVSLPNSKLLLRLRNASGALVDEVDDGIGAPFAGTNSSSQKATMERVDPFSAGTEPTNWRTSTDRNGLDEDSSMVGTPGSYTYESTSEKNPEDETSVPEVPVEKEPVEPMALISEIMPNPIGSDDVEWIELHNNSTEDVDIGGMVLQRGTSTYQFPLGSGSILVAGSTIVLSKEQTGLTLPNTAGELLLLFDQQLIDQFIYEEVVEGVSIGRSDTGEQRPYCVATRGEVNRSIEPAIAIQGLPESGETSSAINLSLEVETGTLKQATCAWNFGDGYTYVGCNPPSHKIKQNGQYDISVTMNDYCGNTVIQKNTIKIWGNKEGNSEVHSGKKQHVGCVPSAFTGVVISEFLPRPDASLEQTEWIELYNQSDVERSLCGWSIDDQEGGSKPYALQGTIRAGEYRVLLKEETGITLNDAGDSVRLIGPLQSGGTGVVLDVSYADAQKGKSYALRNDDVWLWTSTPTRGGRNEFTYPPDQLQQQTVIISAAMPNPVGSDEWDEWIELENLTGRPQWLQGWRLETSAGKRLDLTGTVLAKRERLRILFDRLDFGLPNTNQSVLLIDDAGIIRSTLGWHRSKEGKPVHAVKPDVILDEWRWQPDGTLLYWLPVPDSNRKTLHTLALPDVTAINNEGLYFLKALHTNKNNVLQISSIEGNERVWIQGVDIQAYLLQHGYAHVYGGTDSATIALYTPYEHAARDARVGIWLHDDAQQQIALQQHAEYVEGQITKEGIALSLSTKDSLLELGTVLDVRNSIPEADLYIARGSGAYIAFDGGFGVYSNEDIRVQAVWENPITKEIYRSELLHRIALLQDVYEPCIVVSEVYASPTKGESEWLEVANTCTYAVDMLGWSIDDQEGAGSKPMIIDYPLKIPPQGIYVFSGSMLQIGLNNGGDDVIIRTPRHTLSSAISYPRLKSRQSYAQYGSNFCVTDQSTYAQENTCVQHVVQKPRKTKNTPQKTIQIGLRSIYVPMSIFGSLNTNIDQFNAQLEGLYTNFTILNESELKQSSFGDMIGALAFLCGGFLGWWVWRRIAKYDQK